jgi:hypothetical protein
MRDISPQLEEMPREKQEEEQKVQKKKERDKERKRVERSNNRKDYKKICELLKISSTPKNTLAIRSECLCIHSCQRC